MAHPDECIGWWYLSFAGDEGFRGVVIVEASTLLHAVHVCNQLCLNPHGEVAGWHIPGDLMESDYPPSMRYRLLQREDLPGHMSIREYEEQERQ